MTKSCLILTAIVLLSMSSVVCFGNDLNVVDMSFADDSHGWLAVMEPSPAIFRTTDAGRSWKRITVPGFYRISFFDRVTGIAVKGVSDGEFALYRTADGGEHWGLVATVKKEYLHAVAVGWASAEDAFVIGEGSEGRGWVGQLPSGKPLRVRTDLPADVTAQSTLGIFGDGTGHVWIVGKELVLHSADKGKTWESQYENTVPRIDMGVSGSSIPGGRAWFAAANWEIYRTEDYGKHWVRSLDAVNEGSVNFDSISFYNANNGCAVGNSAFVFCTGDGGLTWNRSKVFRTFLVGSPQSSKIELFASGRGWAVVAGTLYKTEDAGRSFVEMSATGPVPSRSNVADPALETSVNGPTSLAYDQAHGCLYIVEWMQQQLLRLDVKAGIIRAVISRTEDEQANGFRGPHSVAVDAHGNVFLGEFTGRIRLLDAVTGAWSVVVDEPAQKIDHFTPDAMTVDSSGELMVTAFHRILRYRGHGLEPFIGIGSGGFSGDGGLASDATFHFPHGLAVSKAGDIYVADRDNCRIRKINHEKLTISTIAGTGDCDTSGDDGAALFAKLHWPESLVMDSKNNLFFIDGNRVRRIDSSGTISTYAGTGEPGFSGDDGPAEKAKLNNPSGLALDEHGNLYIAEFVNNRIRRVDAATHTITTVAGNGLPHRVDVIM
jgi:photosystem II stability/assembly factor-like uncharacterized protein/sugar lactone lactonase YvrE